MKREWEIFLDTAYYDLWCVREIHDKSFNSITSFHLIKKEDAERLKELLEKAI